MGAGKAADDLPPRGDAGRCRQPGAGRGIGAEFGGVDGVGHEFGTARGQPEGGVLLGRLLGAIGDGVGAVGHQPQPAQHRPRGQLFARGIGQRVVDRPDQPDIGPPPQPQRQRGDQTAVIHPAMDNLRIALRDHLLQPPNRHRDLPGGRRAQIADLDPGVANHLGHRAAGHHRDDSMPVTPRTQCAQIAQQHDLGAADCRTGNDMKNFWLGHMRKSAIGTTIWRLV